MWFAIRLSKVPSPKGSSVASHCRTRAPGTARNCSHIAAEKSVKVNRKPPGSTSLHNFPVPAPTSSTSPSNGSRSANHANHPCGLLLNPCNAIRPVRFPVVPLYCETACAEGFIPRS
jgi:hypothetical protein